MIFAVLASLLASAIGAALVWSSRDRLPDPIATHWGVDGVADGFGTLPGCCGWASSCHWPSPCSWASSARVCGNAPRWRPVGSGTAVFIAAVIFGSTYAQRDTAGSVPLHNGVFVVATVAALAVGTVGALIHRTRPVHRPDPALPADAPSWEGGLRQSKAGIYVGVGAIVLTFAVAMWLFLATGIWFVLLIALILSLVIPLQFARATIDARGLRIRVFDRFTIHRIPLGQMVAAQTATVSALGDYGGYGMRGGFDGSWGWVTSNGEAVRITRHDQKDFVVTVDDAEGAARTLNTLLGVS